MEDVIWAPDGSEPFALRVRGGAGERDIEDVLELRSRAGRIIVRAWSDGAAPLRARGPLARPEARLRITKRKPWPSVTLAAL